MNTITAVLSPRVRADLSWQPGDGFLAGGTWLFSEPQPALRRLVDLAAFGWPALRADDDGLEIAATCRIAELQAWAPPPAWQAARLVPLCCNALLGSFKIWNAATVGGNICLALPAGPMTALAAALDGVCTIWTPGGQERSIPALTFVTGNQRTVLGPGEVLRSLTLPAAALRRRAAFRQASLSPEGRSAALLIGTLADDRLVLTITASTPHPVRVDLASPTAAKLHNAIEAEISAPGLWFDDVHGAPDWRRHMTLRLAEEVRCELEAA